ncbi:hypothetical protein D917_02199 [Trichinella nativa]|uniref:Uncharacterized protein n=1 Tax=Trichinella nativa TaxID=6335 RepID=A0A1Y3EIR2_9BILA|nr:hypothetical protein D917_02199 [Trichinella nativa]
MADSYSALPADEVELLKRGAINKHGKPVDFDDQAGLKNSEAGEEVEINLTKPVAPKRKSRIHMKLEPEIFEIDLGEDGPATTTSTTGNDQPLSISAVPRSDRFSILNYLFYRAKVIIMENKCMNRFSFFLLQQAYTTHIHDKKFFRSSVFLCTVQSQLFISKPPGIPVKLLCHMRLIFTKIFNDEIRSVEKKSADSIDCKSMNLDNASAAAAAAHTLRDNATT